MSTPDETVALHYAIEHLVKNIDQQLSLNYRGLHESIDVPYCKHLREIREALKAMAPQVGFRTLDFQELLRGKK